MPTRNDRQTQWIRRKSNMCLQLMAVATLISLCTNNIVFFVGACIFGLGFSIFRSMLIPSYTDEADNFLKALSPENPKALPKKEVYSADLIQSYQSTPQTPPTVSRKKKTIHHNPISEKGIQHDPKTLSTEIRL